MESMTFIEFEQENCGNADKYISIKELNEQIHNNSIEERRKHEVFTMEDWCQRSQHFVCTHTWCVGRGRFVTLGNLEKDMNRLG